jgi:hydroxyacylglutathione hydrolase
VNQALIHNDLQLAGFLVTHHHSDHTGGVVELVEKFNAPVYAPAHEVIPGATVKVGEGDKITFADLGLEFAVLNVPGHTAGHIAYFGSGAIFCGDTLFSGGCGRLLGGTAAQLHDSLNRLAALPKNTQVYCTHEYTVGNLMFARAVEPDNPAIEAHLQQCRQQRSQDRPTLPTTISVELNINPFLRVKIESVKRSAERHAEHSLNDDLAVFATLRDWKNHF